jgi:hypothetical protein
MYIAKDYWMKCDRCGARYRKSQMREEWTGLWVCTRGCFEQRHPQDFVEGVEDIQTVPVARPDVANKYGSTTLNGAVAKGATSITLTSVSGLVENDPMGIVLDDGIVHWTFIDTLTLTVATLPVPMPGAAASGNVVYLPSLDNEKWT